MQKLVHRFPFLSRITMALLAGLAALVASHFIYNIFPIRPYFPFVGEVLLVFVTWIMYRTEKKPLPPVGLKISGKNMAYLLFGLLAAIAALLTATWLRTLYTGEDWHLSSAVDSIALTKSFYYILPTVMVQELMFRGYLFTKTISKKGVAKANMIFALLFMLVHVVDRDVLQNPAQLIMLLVCIPIGHLWFAAALLRSKTIWFPIGLHWGNNWAVMHLTGTHDSSQTLFYLTDQKLFTGWLPFVIMLLIFNVFFLLVTWITWKGLPFQKVLPDATASTNQ